MVSVSDISFVYTLQVGRCIARRPWRFGESLNNRLPHLLPKQPYPIYIRGCFTGTKGKRWLVREGVVFPNSVTGGGHRLHNVVRDAIAPDVAEGSGQTPRNDGVPSRQQSGQEAGGIADHQQDSSNVRRVVDKEIGRAVDEGGL